MKRDTRVHRSGGFKFKLIVAVCIVCGFFCALTASASDCGLTPPPGWKYRLAGGTGFSAGMYLSPDGMAALNLQSIPKRPGYGLKQAAEDLMRRWRRMKGFELLSRESGTVNGARALRLLVEYDAEPGKRVRQEQFICLTAEGLCLIAYTAPAGHFETNHKAIDKLLATADLGGGKKAVTPVAEPKKPPEWGAAVFGPTLLKGLAGPLYSGAYLNKTPQGKRLAGYHAKLVGDLATLTLVQAEEQKKALKAWSQNLGFIVAVAELLESGAKTDPRLEKPFQKMRVYVHIGFELTSLKAALKGGREALAASLPPAAEVGMSKTGAQNLTMLIKAVEDVRYLMLKEYEQALFPAYRLFMRLSEAEGLPASLQSELAGIKKEYTDTMVAGIAAQELCNIRNARRLALIGILDRFDREAAKTYAAHIKAALPLARQKLAELERVSPGSPEVEVLKLTIQNLTRIQKAAAAPKPGGLSGLLRNAGDLLVSTAHAAGHKFLTWDWGLFGDNLLSAGTSLVKAPLHLVRGAAHGTGYLSKRLGYAVSSTSAMGLNPGYVFTPAEKLIGEKPKLLASKEYRKIFTRHDQNNVAGHRRLVHDSTEEYWGDIRTGKAGARALTTSTNTLDNVEQAIWDKSREHLGYYAGSAVAFAASTGYSIVMDIPRSVAHLANPSSSTADKTKAVYDIAANLGASVCGLKFTGKKFQGVLKDKAAQAGTRIMKLFAKNPKAAKVAARVSNTTKAAAEGVTERGVKLSKEFLEGAGKQVNKNAQVLERVTKSLKTDTLLYKDLQRMTKNVKKSIMGQGGKQSAAQVAKEFFTDNYIKHFDLSMANNFVSSFMLHPGVKAVTEKPGQSPPLPGGLSLRRPTSPEPKKAERSFKNKGIIKATEGPVERSFNNKGLLAWDKRKKEKKDRQEELERKARAAEKAETPPAVNQDIPVIPIKCVMDVKVWHPAFSKWKYNAVYYIDSGVVTGEATNTFNMSDHNNKNMKCQNQRITGKFEGSIKDNIITGVWREKHHPYKCTYWGERSVYDKKAKKSQTVKYSCTYTMWSRSTNHEELILRKDGRLVMSYRGENTHNIKWGPGCDKSVAGTTKTSRNSFYWDDPKMEAKYRRKLVGVWQMRGGAKK